MVVLVMLLVLIVLCVLWVLVSIRMWLLFCSVVVVLLIFFGFLMCVMLGLNIVIMVLLMGVGFMCGFGGMVLFSVLLGLNLCMCCMGILRCFIRFCIDLFMGLVLFEVIMYGLVEYVVFGVCYLFFLILLSSVLVWYFIGLIMGIFMLCFCSEVMRKFFMVG